MASRAILALALLACSGSTPEVTVGGPLLAWNTDLRVIGLPQSGRGVVAVTPGLQTVELLDFRHAPPRVRSVAGPDSSCKAFPVATAIGRFDSDEWADIAVVDPSCGQWMTFGTAEDQFQVARRTDGFWESSTPQRFLEAGDWDRNGQDDLILAAPEQMLLLVRKNDGWAQQALSFLGDRVPPLRITNILTYLPDRGILFQRAGFFSLVKPPFLEVETLKAILPQDQFAPFSAFDQLTALSMDGCPSFVMGIGLFPSEAGAGIRRNIEVIQLEEGKFTTETLDLGSSLDTFAVLPSSRGSFLALAIGGPSNQKTAVSLAVSDCGKQLDILGRATVDFGWRTVDAPTYFTEDRIPKTASVKLVGLEASEAMGRFVHYDGFDVRIFDVTVSDGTILETKHVIHESRSDLSW